MDRMIAFNKHRQFNSLLFNYTRSMDTKYPCSGYPKGRLLIFEVSHYGKSYEVYSGGLSKNSLKSGNII